MPFYVFVISTNFVSLIPVRLFSAFTESHRVFDVGRGLATLLPIVIILGCVPHFCVRVHKRKFKKKPFI